MYVKNLLAQVLRNRGKPITSAAAADLVVDIVEKGNCSAVYHAISEDDLVRILKHAATMIASDAAPGEPEFGRDVPHPREYGTFARVLGAYVREQHVLSLEDAVRKMSSFPASRMRLVDRGVVRPGMKADLAVYDAATIKDLATYAQLCATASVRCRRACGAGQWSSCAREWQDDRRAARPRAVWPGVSAAALSSSPRQVSRTIPIHRPRVTPPAQETNRRSRSAANRRNWFCPCRKYFPRPGPGGSQATTAFCGMYRVQRV